MPTAETTLLPAYSATSKRSLTSSAQLDNELNLFDAPPGPMEHVQSSSLRSTGRTRVYDFASHDTRWNRIHAHWLERRLIEFADNQIGNEHRKASRRVEFYFRAYRRYCTLLRLPVGYM
jgi:hypothetical protein